MGADSNGDCSSLGYHSKFKGYSQRANPPEAPARDTQKFFDPSCPRIKLAYFSWESPFFLNFDKKNLQISCTLCLSTVFV